MVKTIIGVGATVIVAVSSWGYALSVDLASTNAIVQFNRERLDKQDKAIEGINKQYLEFNSMLIDLINKQDKRISYMEFIITQNSDIKIQASKE